MAVDVWLMAVEKERSLPWASFYLGGNGVERAMSWIGSPLCDSEPVQNNFHRAKYYPIIVGDAVKLLDFLEYEEALYEDHEMEGAREFLEGLEDFSFREEYILYVEIA